MSTIKDSQQMLNKQIENRLSDHPSCHTWVGVRGQERRWEVWVESVGVNTAAVKWGQVPVSASTALRGRVKI